MGDELWHALHFLEALAIFYELHDSIFKSSYCCLLYIVDHQLEVNCWD